jgi:LPXTG-motif cell wall-anchored protein
MIVGGKSWLYLAWCFLVPLLAVIGAPASFSQDVAPGTPSELRDFKLDPDKPAPAPTPTPQAEPAKQPRIENTPQAPITKVPEPTRRPPVPSSAQNRSNPKAIKPAATTDIAETPKADVKTDTAAPVPESISEPAGPTQASAPQLPPANTRAVPDAVPKTGEAPLVTPVLSRILPYAWTAFVAAGLIVLIGAGILFRRRKRRFTHSDQAAFDFEAKPQAMPETVIPGHPVTEAPVQDMVKRPDLDISFVPEKATIGLVNLTIKGQLHIINKGSVEADAMYLHAGVISASDEQDNLMTGFFAASADFDKDLGAAKSGERIGLEMDLQIPLNELPAYALGNQKMLVPIILIRVVYKWGAMQQRDEARLSCIIGREANPPKPKMGPLRMDMGPRSFANLGQRPVLV